ncbi:unnamed protein product [Cuscuta epithymum]|uniref:Uncharacterized protein n=1 Tax=Cuscuta epithymum TaxID=186058 RepID=A0AAV0FST9_9ASTE|nr:unnamed protein product [Cuscuta epithymum]
MWKILLWRKLLVLILEQVEGERLVPQEVVIGLVDKQGGRSHHRRPYQEDEDIMRQERMGSIAETESSVTKDEGKSSAWEVSIDQKRRRVWKDPAHENNSGEEMALDKSKNGEEAGTSEFLDPPDVFVRLRLQKFHCGVYFLVVFYISFHVQTVAFGFCFV